MKTIYLNPLTWDFAIDVDGNIAAADEPYRLAQDAATAILTFTGDCYYNQNKGIPYVRDILGKFPPLELVKSLMIAESLKVIGIVDAQVFLTSADRKISGQVQVTDISGAISAANF